MNILPNANNILRLLKSSPDAIATVRGDRNHKSIFGTVKFYQTSHGVAVLCEIYGLPKEASKCDGKIFAIHIHEGSSCTGNENEPFADAKMHYNPHGCAHPHHAGDLPPLFASKGYALALTLSDRFTVDEIVGRIVIIHNSPDDFTTQPSGNSGIKIACGEIKRFD